MVLGRLHDSGLDAEFAQAKAVVGLKLDHRPGEHRQPLLAGMLEQITGQLSGKRLFVVGEALAVGRREEHAVLVGDVRARDGERLVLLHLAHQLARDFDRAHLGAEGTTERAFYEAGDLALEASKHTHLRARGRRAGASPCYASRDRAALDCRRLRSSPSAVGNSATATAASAPSTAPRGIGCPVVPPANATAVLVADTRAADQATTRTRSSAADRPRTNQGKTSAAAAQTTAGASTPELIIGPSTSCI